ncbi:hypothetical protein Daura_22585 [Dactylosporangium aurantiacum]|uniref:ABM domain-containing protein n=1 Tax=Dactylosporangium aurantiacum TaxID=35754 RepID=A0A9Q9MRP3_9ACTN|nr:hypothetical protein [Dactylosporangium aurantiacum]MDG6107703.1 hypothetical protein [Dactylosporangium aurantiacum]UWZ58707.1 hypothetical protein Daura_22585 [Dactylosporangium aurantiacum]
MSEALEMTTFRLVPGLTGADFVRANDDINDYLRRQPGFRWRRITEDGDGTITDIVAWDSAAHGRRSASGIMTEMAGSPVHATIDHTTVDFRIVPVLQHVTS